MGRANTPDDVWRRAAAGPGGCINWTGCTDQDGYGIFEMNYKARKAHRVAFESIRGAIPEGLTIDHLCRNRACMNPYHMEPVSASENTRRAARHRDPQTHCLRGHEFTPGNTRRTPSGGRICRECQRVREAARPPRTR